MARKKTSTMEALNQILHAEEFLEQMARQYIESDGPGFAPIVKRQRRHALQRAALLYGATVRIRLGPAR